MSVFPFKGDPNQGGIPRKAKVRIESLPDRQPVFTGVASGAVYLDLDPGKYIASVVKMTGTNQSRDLDNCSYVTEFYHEVDEAAWKELQSIRPKLARVVNTSEGPRYRCRVPGCNDSEFTSIVGSVMHEVTDHFGIPRDVFLANPRAGLVVKAFAKGSALAQTLVAEEQKPNLRQVFGAVPTQSADEGFTREAPAGYVPVLVNQ